MAFDVVVQGLNAPNSKGVYRCLIFKSANGFPSQPKLALQSVNGVVTSNQGQCIFKNIPAGVYAISTFHDENSNGQIDKNVLGMPKEKYGFSNNASKPFGPPDFSEAAFQLSQSKIIQINLK